MGESPSLEMPSGPPWPSRGGFHLLPFFAVFLLPSMALPCPSATVIEYIGQHPTCKDMQNVCALCIRLVNLFGTIAVSDYNRINCNSCAPALVTISTRSNN